MLAATSDQRSALHWIGWIASCLVLFLFTQYWADWFMASPMMEFSNELAGRGFFPPDGLGNRFQYFRQLVIAPGENVSYATCVLCSITVRGGVFDQVTAYWGDVTVESGGSLGAHGVKVNGGRIALMPGVRVSTPTLLANGGGVIVDPSIPINSNSIRSSPRFFYPGQRSWPSEGVRFLVVVLLLASACGGWLVWGRFRERVEEAARRPVGSALLGIVLFVLILPFLNFLTFLFLYIFPLLAGLLLFLVSVAYWFVFAIGFAGMTKWIGSVLWNANRLGARLTGAAILIALMLVPVVGLFVMGAVVLVALGAGTGIRLLKRPEAWLRSLSNRRAVS